MSAEITVDQARETLRRYAQQLRDLEGKLDKQIGLAADSEAVYRKTLALKYAEHRNAGAAVAESELRARADVVELSRDRDVARDRVRALLEELEDRRGERNAYQSLLRFSDGDGGSS
jgi:uncharacterized coiled-coil protein SlyX